MCRKLLSVLLCTICALWGTQHAVARTVTVDRAREIAADFLSGSDPALYSLVYTSKDAAGNPQTYIFNAPAGSGWVIVAADDRIDPIVGFNDHGAFDATRIPGAMQALLGNVTTLITERPERPTTRFSTTPLRAATGVNTWECATAAWSQEGPFNGLIPGQRLTGCVGLATSILMKYHAWPAQGRGTAGSLDLSSHSYDFANMRTDNYRSGYSSEQGMAVALLVSDAAQAILTDFGQSASSAFEVRVPSALINNFNYDPGVSFKKRQDVSQFEWDEIIAGEIKAGRPLIYSGQDVTSGHAFVCDGARLQGSSWMFHFNFGWGGAGNGWFRSDAITPTVSKSHSYTDLMTIIYNIKPDASAAPAGTWSPVQLTNDNNQPGMTLSVTDLVPGQVFNVRAGSFRNINNTPFSGAIAVALFAADGTRKAVMAERGFSLAALQNSHVESFTATAPADVAAGDYLRIVTRTGADGPWLPVAGDARVIAEVAATGYVAPTFAITLPAYVEGADIRGGETVVRGRDYEFTVESLSPENVVTVKANGFILSPVSGNRYRIGNVTCDQEIKVIVQRAADVVSKRVLWVDAGTLSTLLSEAEQGTVKDLTLFGTIDIDDFTFIRERLKLTRLDLGGTSIVAKGSSAANTVPQRALAYIRSLESLVLPSGVTTFEEGAFRGTGLRSIVIPASVSKCGYNVFNACSSLTDVYVRRSTPIFANWCVFSGTPKANLWVPAGCVGNYKDPAKVEKYYDNYWREFRNIAEGNPPSAGDACTVTFQDAKGIRFTPELEGSEFEKNTVYTFSVEADETIGDATLEVFAGRYRLTPGAGGKYSVTLTGPTLIYTRLKQPEPASASASPVTLFNGRNADDRGVGLATSVINVPRGQTFNIRVNALNVPQGCANTYYAAVLTDAAGNIKEVISSPTAFGSDLTVVRDLACTVKDATVRPGNLIRLATSLDRKKWSFVNAAASGICDRLKAVGNEVQIHAVNVPSVSGAVIEGAATEIAHGMPFRLKVKPQTFDKVVSVTLNGKMMQAYQPIAEVYIPSVTEDLDFGIQLTTATADSYTIVNVSGGDLAGALASLDATKKVKVKIIGTMLASDFNALRANSAIQYLDLALVTIKGDLNTNRTLPTNAFTNGNTALVDVILPNDLEAIEAMAFAGCNKLTSITIPESVNRIGQNAFAACDALTSITVYNAAPNNIYMPVNPFRTSNPKGITVTIPYGSDSDYLNHQWWSTLTIKSTVKTYNIELDRTRCFQYNSTAKYVNLPKPANTSSHAIGLPNCDFKANNVYRPGTAFRVLDNGRDVLTYPYHSSDNTSSRENNFKPRLLMGSKTGAQYIVKLNPRQPDANYLDGLQDHRIDIVYYYEICATAADGVTMTFSEDDDFRSNIWDGAKRELFTIGATGTFPRLYREARDYRFTLSGAPEGMEYVVRATSTVCTAPAVVTGTTPSNCKVTTPMQTKTVETALFPDENGVYTIADLQGNTTVAVTLRTANGVVLTPAQIASMAPEDVEHLTEIGISGTPTAAEFDALRSKFPNLEVVTMTGADLETLPDGAFAGMTSLERVELPAFVTTIGQGAFQGCTGLTSLYFDGVTQVGRDAFAGCSNLSEITFNTVDMIQAGAFRGCMGLTAVTINTPAGSAPYGSPRRALRAHGLTAETFEGANPNLIVVVSDAAMASSVAAGANIVHNGSSERTALTDINVETGLPFNNPVDFNLGDRQIACTVDLHSVDPTDNKGWTGVVLPFIPTEISVAGEPYTIATRGENTVSIVTYSNDFEPSMTIMPQMHANYPFMMRLNNESLVNSRAATAPVTFSTYSYDQPEWWESCETQTYYDVPATPDAIEIRGPEYTLNASYSERPAAEGDYLLNAAGSHLERVADPSAVTPLAPGTVYARAITDTPSDMIEIGAQHEISSTEEIEIAGGLRLSRQGSMLVINTAEARTVEIFTPAGIRVASYDLFPGQNTVELPAGIYILANTKIAL